MTDREAELTAELEAARSQRPCPVGGCDPVDRLHTAIQELGTVMLKQHQSQMRAIEAYQFDTKREPTLVGFGRWKLRRARPIALVAVLVSFLALVPAWYTMIRAW
jgi:hypothetical protein